MTPDDLLGSFMGAALDQPPLASAQGWVCIGYDGEAFDILRHDHTTDHERILEAYRERIPVDDHLEVVTVGTVDRGYGLVKIGDWLETQERTMAMAAMIRMDDMREERLIRHVIVARIVILDPAQPRIIRHHDLVIATDDRHKMLYRIEKHPEASFTGHEKVNNDTLLVSHAVYAILLQYAAMNDAEIERHC
jgi:hypothetical protein